MNGYPRRSPPPRESRGGYGDTREYRAPPPPEFYDRRDERDFRPRDDYRRDDYRRDDFRRDDYRKDDRYDDRRDDYRRDEYRRDDFRRDDFRRDDRRGSPPRRERRRVDPGDRPTPEPSKVLGIFGLSIHTTARDLEEMFGRFGRIEKVDIITDKQTLKSRGFGFITFVELDSAAAAREAMNGHVFNQREMRVDYSLTRRAHSPTPGRYAGGQSDGAPMDEPRSYSPEMDAINRRVSQAVPSDNYDNTFSGLSSKEKKAAQRRCIAEDPEWNLAVVDRLSDLCVRVIVANFEKRPILSGIPLKHRENVLQRISVDLPLSIAGPLIPDDSYWKRRSNSKFRNCDISKHGNSWKRLFFELHVQKLAESFQPKKLAGVDEISEFEKELKMASPFLEGLNIRQMLPTLPADGTIVKSTDPHPDHIDLLMIFNNLSNLKTLKLYYGVLDCGINFSWTVFGMTENDCSALSSSLRLYPNVLQSLSIPQSGIDDDRVRAIAGALLENKTLAYLDLSHNAVGDSGARGLAKLLMSPSTAIATVNLANNKISRLGGQALGRALQQNKVLVELNLRMNKLGDSGGAAIVAGLGRGLATTVLKSLDLSSNGLGTETVGMLCALLKRNGKSLTTLDISCNKLSHYPISAPLFAAAPAAGVTGMLGTLGTPPGGNSDTSDLAGKMLFEALSQNKYITSFDIRVTDLSPELSLAIKGIVTENAQ